MDQLLPGLLTTTEARERGITRAQLRGRAYRRLARARYVEAGTRADPVDVLLAVVGRGLPPGAALGTWAAARLHERAARRGKDLLTVFDGWLPALDSAERTRMPVLVCAPRRARVEVPSGARIFRSDLAAHEVEERFGVRVTSPARTAFDLSRLLPLVPAVVMLDRLRALGLVTAEDVAEQIDARPRWRGVPRAREVVSLSADGAESPRESMLRLCWVWSGMPEPLANRVVRTERGQFVARVDLIDPEAGVIAEYDGSDHADARRRASDAARQEALEDLGLVTVRANAPDLADEQARASWQVRLRAAYARAERRTERRWVITDR